MTTLSIICHLTYVVFSLTTMGMFYDSSPLAPLFEFLRCGFFSIYSYSNKGRIPLLSQSFSWSKELLLFNDHPALLSLDLELNIYWILRSYFVVSTIVWGSVILTSQISKRLSFEHQHQQQNRK